MNRNEEQVFRVAAINAWRELGEGGIDRPAMGTDWLNSYYGGLGLRVQATAGGSVTDTEAGLSFRYADLTTNVIEVRASEWPEGVWAAFTSLEELGRALVEYEHIAEPNSGPAYKDAPPTPGQRSATDEAVARQFLRDFLDWIRVVPEHYAEIDEFLHDRGIRAAADNMLAPTAMQRSLDRIAASLATIAATVNRWDYQGALYSRRSNADHQEALQESLMKGGQ